MGWPISLCASLCWSVSTLCVCVCVSLDTFKFLFAAACVLCRFAAFSVHFKGAVLQNVELYFDISLMLCLLKSFSMPVGETVN